MSIFNPLCQSYDSAAFPGWASLSKTLEVPHLVIPQIRTDGEWKFREFDLSEFPAGKDDPEHNRRGSTETTQDRPFSYLSTPLTVLRFLTVRPLTSRTHRRDRLP